MVSKIKTELDFWVELRDFNLTMCKEAQDRGMCDEVAERNYFASNAIVNVLERLLK